MANKWAFIGDRVFIIRWLKLDVNEFPHVLRNVANARVSAGKPLTYVVIIPAEHPVPNPKEREALEQLTQELNQHCGEFHMVVEGQGVLKTVQRAALAGIQALSARPMKIHARLDEALRAIAPQIGAKGDDLVRLAQARGVDVSVTS